MRIIILRKGFYIYLTTNFSTVLRTDLKQPLCFAEQTTAQEQVSEDDTKRSRYGLLKWDMKHSYPPCVIFVVMYTICFSQVLFVFSIYFMKMLLELDMQVKSVTCIFFNNGKVFYLFTFLFVFQISII